MKIYAILLVVFVLTYISGTEGCSCAPSYPQSQYCKSAFVVVGNITGSTIQGLEKIYNVDVIRVYKGAVSTGSAKIKTASEDGMCGVNLDINEIYLFNGNKQEDEMWINICDTMSTLPGTDYDKTFPLDSYYDCRCRVLNRDPFPEERIPKNTCSLGGRFECPPESGALGDNAECRYSEANDACAWEC